MRIRTIWYEGWPFALLCILGASRWLLEGAVPAATSTMLSQGIGCALAAGLGAGGMAFRRMRQGRVVREHRRWWGAAVGGCLVLVGPLLAQAIGGRRLGADAATLALALVPVVAAVAGSADGGAETGDLPGLLWPGLAGSAGLLLLLPQPSFSTWRPWFGLAALPLLVGLGGWMAVRPGVPGEGEAGSGEGPFCGALLLAAGVFGAFWWASPNRSEGGVAWQALGLDCVMAVLTLLALRRLGARRWAAQFLVMPLLGLAEGLVFLRPVLDSRSWLGLGMVALGAGYQLLRGETSGGVPTLRAREDVPGA